MLGQNAQINKTFQYLVEIETLAQDILTLRDAKLELANTQNKLKESLRTLRQTQERYSFLKLGSIYVEYRTEDCRTIVQEEIASVNEEYESISKSIREKLLKKRDLEYEPEIKGVGLKPLSYNEAEGLLKAFGVKQ